LVRDYVSYTRDQTRWNCAELTLHELGDFDALSGFINPYPGKLGVVEEGALADLLLVDGNPLESTKLVEDPDKNFVVIMKDGIVYKNMMSK